MSREHSKNAHKFRLIENPCADNYECQSALKLRAWDALSLSHSLFYYLVFIYLENWRNSAIYGGIAENSEKAAGQLCEAR